MPFPTPKAMLSTLYVVASPIPITFFRVGILLSLTLVLGSISLVIRITALPECTVSVSFLFSFFFFYYFIAELFFLFRILLFFVFYNMRCLWNLTNCNTCDGSGILPIWVIVWLDYWFWFSGIWGILICLDILFLNLEGLSICNICMLFLIYFAYVLWMIWFDNKCIRVFKIVFT